MKFLSLLAVFILLITFTLPKPLSAQEQEPFKPYFSVGADAGVLFPFGDITSDPKKASGEEAKVGFGVQGNYRILPALGLQVRLLFGQLHGDRQNKSPEYSFDSRIIEGTVNAMIHLNQLIAPNAAINNKASLYGFAGIGFVSFNADLFSQVTKIDETSGMSLAIPFGGGLEITLSERVNIFLESGFRYTTNDEFDGYSGYQANDMYSFSSLGLRIKL